MLRVAIVGRPNVGKSTLFNRLAGRHLAIVNDVPGVTRDWQAAEARLGDRSFLAIDTAGLEDVSAGTLEGRMRQFTEAVVAEADVVLFLVDSRAGLLPLDRHFANALRRIGTPVILVANKCESRSARAGAEEALALGLGDPIPLSAEHGLGLGELFEVLEPYFAAAPADKAADDDDAAADSGPLRLAIVGRPNVGKSTLANRLIGEERLLTGPEPGVTRDAIPLDWEWQGRAVRLVDTAGLRRKSRIEAELEKASATEALRAIRLAELVMLVIDATAGLEKQDLTIARHVVDEGRALVLVLNKWDLIDERQKTLKEIRDRLARSLPQIKGLRVVPVSARTGRQLDRLMPEVVRAHEICNTRLSTGRLNRWLAALVDSHPPPAPSGRRIQLRYITQVKDRPPTFALFANKPHDLPASYLRYVENALREAFGLEGVPIRLEARKGANPYAGKKPKKVSKLAKKKPAVRRRPANRKD